MGKTNRRRLGLAAAPFMLARASSAAAAPTLASASVASPSDMGSSILPSQHALSTAFSCGAHWAASQTCAALCPSGRDSDCPSGQRCFGGIPCSALDEGTTMEDVLARQAHLERQEVTRLKRERLVGYVDRFVCGSSYEQAASSCASAVELNPAGTKGIDASGGIAAYYCPSGNARQCPQDLQCYAAVSCPRSTHEEEPPIIDAASLRVFIDTVPLNALRARATEPMLLRAANATFQDANATTPSEGEIVLETPRHSLLSEGSTLGALNSLLSSKYGLN